MVHDDDKKTFLIGVLTLVGGDYFAASNINSLLPEAKPTGLVAVLCVCLSVCDNEPLEAFAGQFG